MNVRLLVIFFCFMAMFQDGLAMWFMTEEGKKACCPNKRYFGEAEKKAGEIFQELELIRREIVNVQERWRLKKEAFRGEKESFKRDRKEKKKKVTALYRRKGELAPKWIPVLAILEKGRYCSFGSKKEHNDYEKFFESYGKQFSLCHKERFRSANFID